jgi:MGT family glycosyltransferase
MATAIVYNVPARGHINPTLPVVAQLVAAGEKVHYYASAGYRRGVEATGAEFHPYRGVPDDYFPATGLTGAQPVRTATELARTAAALMPGLLSEAAGFSADYVIADSLCCWGWLAARAMRLPLVVSNTFLVLTPAVVARRPSMAHLLLSVGRGLPGLPGFRRIWRPLARRHGVRPLRLDQFFAIPGDFAVNYTAAILQPAERGLRSRVSFVGPSVAARIDDPDFPWDWLDGRPVVYASLGTINNGDPDFYRACVSAFGDGAVQLVLSTGDRLDAAALGPLPRNVLVRTAVPQLALLAKVALFITHAGMNSVQEALLNGVPMLAVPRQPEQLCVARRVVVLGAGRLLPRRALSAARLRTEATRVMSDPAYRGRARALGDILAATGGADQAAREVLEFVRTAS